MPRHRLALRAYATFHGQLLVGPYADPNLVEAEAWAELRRRCAHLDRAKLTPMRRPTPFSGLTLKVNSVTFSYRSPWRTPTRCWWSNKRWRQARSRCKPS
jgi:hypothetical protein